MTSNGGRAVRRLVIVESPAKAKTIRGYLGDGYEVEASVGHIRDLPKSAADIPAKYKKEKWARLGVDIDHDFEPLYIVSPDKKSKVSELKRMLEDADELLLATDEDREGEAIAWHLLQVLKPKVPVRRMVFHEITKDAIRAAAESPRDLDQRLVDAQEARRIIDRLYGYEVSPVLWKKVTTGLSAGRVQSVATRLVVERERERMAFVSAGYWDIAGVFDPQRFTATLVAVDGRRIARGSDFDDRAKLKKADVVVLDESAASSLAESLTGVGLSVRSVEEKPYRRSPAAPFITSTLQQEASRKLRMSAQTAMRVAQRLYENGFITYMRTDSTTLSGTAIAAARSQVTELYGADHVSDKPRSWAKKVKNAQEAHEAVRPAGDSFRTPGELASQLSPDELKLYELIWKRTLASQMSDARGTTMTVRFGGVAQDGRDAEFSATGTVITHRGFLAVYEEGKDADSESDSDDDERRLPALKEGDTVTALELSPEGHSTNPPARYTEASLVRALEERGIGRPSTYASTISTIVDRGYVFKRGTALVPSFLAFSVVTLMERHFADLVDYSFTARMEEILDLVAAGETPRQRVLERFYFGDAGRDFPGLHPLVSNLGDIDAREVNSMPLGDGIVLRVGRYGPYVQRGDGDDLERANVPHDMTPDELTLAKAIELLDAPSGDRELGAHPDTGRDIIAKSGRYGPYVTEVLPDDVPKTGKNAVKPRTASLMSTMTLDTVTLEDAVRLLSLPRVVGQDPSDNEEITAQNGRYGPYLKKGTDSRSLASEDQIFTVTLDEALAIYAQPKQRGRRAAQPPLRDLGADPVTGNQVLVKDGRFGPYVTDGETNATLRRTDAPETITIERAAELLADKRAQGPAPKKRAAKRPTTKRTVKKTAKKTAKKAAAKK
ncbi:MAG: type I DNA topoisomerase [Actinomycetes bacterium]